MIAKLTGRIDEIDGDSLVIDVGGVGYLVFCSNTTINVLSTQGDIVSLFIETHVREDHIHLFGFADPIEQKWFRLLTTVQGVGTKVALAMLSAAQPNILSSAIAAGDKTVITSAPGVGPKLAARIISELRDKIGDVVFYKDILPKQSAEDADGKEGIDQNQIIVDAVSALVNLGYGRTEAYGVANQVIQRLGYQTNVELVIKNSLAELSSSARG